jgi:hypothetical protein
LSLSDTNPEEESSFFYTNFVEGLKGFWSLCSSSNGQALFTSVKIHYKDFSFTQFLQD